MSLFCLQIYVHILCSSYYVCHLWVSNSFLPFPNLSSLWLLLPTLANVLVLVGTTDEIETKFIFFAYIIVEAVVVYQDCNIGRRRKAVEDLLALALARRVPIES